MFLHYLGKFNNSNLLQISKKMQTKNLIFCTHLVLVHMTYILIICFNFSFLLNIFLQIADDWRRRRKRSLVNVSCALDPRSVSPLWCLLAYRSWAAQTSSSSTRVLRSTALTTVMCSCQSSYYPWCARYQVNFSYFNRTTPQYTGTRHCATSRAMPAFIPPDIWPANSPDLNPVDYRIYM